MEDLSTEFESDKGDSTAWDFSLLVTSAVMNAQQLANTGTFNTEAPTRSFDIEELHLHILSELFVIALQLVSSELSEAARTFVLEDNANESFKRMFFWLNQNFELHTILVRELSLQFVQEPEKWQLSPEGLSNLLEQLTNYSDYLSQFHGGR
jgi:hypothetical protein